MTENIAENKENIAHTCNINLEASLLELCYQVERFLHRKQLLTNASARWNVLNKNIEFFEIGKFTTTKESGSGLFSRIKVFKDRNWTLFHGEKVLDMSCTQNDIPDKMTCLNDIVHVLSLAESLRICTGINSADYDVLPQFTKDISGKVVGQCDPLSSCRRSVSCTGVVNKGIFSKVCDHCNQLRKHLSAQRSRLNNNNKQSDCTSSKSKVNKRFLTMDQLLEREEDQKRRRINAEERGKYWHLKALEEKQMRMMVKQDNEDLLIMFETVNKDHSFEHNPDMAMFWELQKDIISKSTNKKCIRWHPL